MTINEIRDANRAAGFHWFDPETMRFFGTKVLPEVCSGDGGIYFVTEDNDYRGRRGYTVRQFLPLSCEINTWGNIAGRTLHDARNTIITLAAGEDVTAGVEVEREEYQPVTLFDQFLFDLYAHSSDRALVNQADATLLMIHALDHQTWMERACNEDLTEEHDAEIIACRNRCVEAAHRLGVRNVIFGGDPRGCTVKLVFHDGYTNDFGGQGYCVPMEDD